MFGFNILEIMLSCQLPINYYMKYDVTSYKGIFTHTFYSLHINYGTDVDVGLTISSFYP